MRSFGGMVKVEGEGEVDLHLHLHLAFALLSPKGLVLVVGFWDVASYRM
jgi:hypothetical protein